jgi:FkbM family methyltransferase
MEELREKYNILSSDYFFVIGGHEGDISDRIIRKFNPNVYIFEPNSYWYNYLSQKYSNNPKVKVFNFGFLEEETDKKLYQFGNGDGSNIYNQSEKYEICKFKKLSDFIKEEDINVKLIEFNCEGSEYEIIQDLYLSGEILRFLNIQVQFHKIEDYTGLYQKSNEILSKTHIKKWGFDYIWESWELI